MFQKWTCEPILPSTFFSALDFARTSSSCMRLKVMLCSPSGRMSFVTMNITGCTTGSSFVRMRSKIPFMLSLPSIETDAWSQNSANSTGAIFMGVG